MRILIRIATSPWTRRLLPLVIAAGLITGLWPASLRALGVGLVLPVTLALLVSWLIWQRHLPLFLQAWNRWLGLIAFAAALLGIFAFFNPGDGILEEFSLGGYGATAIIRSQNATGVVIVIALALVGTACVAPYLSWRLSQSGARNTVPVVRQLAVWGQKAAGRLREFYWNHPLHETVVSWARKRRAPRIREIAYVPPPSTFEQAAREAQETDRAEGTPEGLTPTPAPQEPGPATFAQAPAGDTALMTATPQLALPHLGRWQLPSIELLSEIAQAELSQAEIEKRARMIEEALASYGVESKVVQMNVGPAVTQFGVEPGWDRKVKEIKEKDKDGNVNVRFEEVSRTRVKVERINSLSNDLALALAASSIRIEAPIPGTSLVGIEVPNSSMGTVALREVLEGSTFEKLSSRSKLAIALGKATAGEVAVADLAKMPHLLIAGATGSGKTVCLDSIIVSLLMSNTPDELRFVMIDPKRVELIVFNGVPHLLTPVVTEGEKAVDILKWVEREMDSRYRKLASVGIHNIERYNKSHKTPKQMTYLIVVVDELADLMLARADEVEPLLCRLAQMGRAVGIHLIVATQRPSVDVITGLIKANFPSRISFAVVSQVDSRTILDSIGAEKLLGRGDMLYLSADMSKPKRLQGCFTSPEEMERVVHFWREQAKVQAAEIFTAPIEDVTGEDPLLDEARLLAKRHRQISSSFLQRQLRVGYARAEKLMRLLENEDAAKADRSQQL